VVVNDVIAASSRRVRHAAGLWSALADVEIELVRTREASTWPGRRSSDTGGRGAVTASSRLHDRAMP